MKLVKTVRSLGVSRSNTFLFSTAKLISSVCRISYLELCCTYATLSPKIVHTQKNWCVFVLCKINDCNFLLAGCPKFLLSSLQKVQNNAAGVILRSPKSAHVSPLLHFLHWPPVEQRIKYKVSLPCPNIISVQAAMHLPLRLPSPLHFFSAALFFCRHLSAQNTILPHKVQWPALFSFSSG